MCADGITPQSARRGTCNGEGNFSGYQGIHCGVFIKLYNNVHGNLFMSYNPFSVSYRILIYIPSSTNLMLLHQIHSQVMVGRSGSHFAEQLQQEVNDVDIDLFLVAYISGFIARHVLCVVRCDIYIFLFLISSNFDNCVKWY
jgi:hypothetical protein